MAAIPLVALLLLATIAPGPKAGLTALAAGVAALLLTTVDAEVVRFMAVSGVSTGRTVAVHVRPMLVFAGLTLGAALLGGERLAALALTGVTAVALTVMTARVLAYRVRAKRSADLLLSVHAGAVVVAGLAFPILAPVVAAALLWHWQRRAGPATWLLT